MLDHAVGGRAACDPWRRGAGKTVLVSKKSIGVGFWFWKSLHQRHFTVPFPGLWPGIFAALTVGEVIARDGFGPSRGGVAAR